MLTIFTIPKAFTGKNSILQRNALKSWKWAVPGSEIILFGDDPGVGAAAAEFGLRHFPGVRKTEHGTPLLDDAFEAAQAGACFDLLVYINADIILTPDFPDAVGKVGLDLFLMSGRRWDLEITEDIDFSDKSQVSALFSQKEVAGVLHGYSGMDYFVFPRGSIKMPSFAVGRPGWDSWLIYETRRRGIPVIDASAAITVIHQNHDYSHSKFGEKGRVGGPEMKQNFALAGGMSRMLTLREADWMLAPTGLIRPGLTQRIFSALSAWRFWVFLMVVKRKLHGTFGA